MYDDLDIQPLPTPLPPDTIEEGQALQPPAPNGPEIIQSPPQSRPMPPSVHPATSTMMEPGAPATVPPQQQSWAMHGPFDAFAAKVVSVYPTSTNPADGTVQGITVERCLIGWGAHNAPIAAKVGQMGMEPTPTVLTARPFPPRHDQSTYHVVVGEIVTVLQGKDGAAYYLSDELPFLAMVIPPDTTYTEDFQGGAGNLYIKVRRVMLTGDPITAVVVPADMTLADGATYVEYAYVRPNITTGQAHGLRSGDYVWCQRRGQYIFAQPAKQQFLAQIVNAGPDGEAAATPPAYWIKELDPTVTYTTNSYTYTTAVRPAADPKGKALGRYGRWVMAYNMAHVAGAPLLTDGTVYVLVNIIADPATAEAMYVFGGAPGVGGGTVVKLTAVGAAGHYTAVLQTWDAGTSAWVDGATVDAANLLETTGLIAYTLDVTGTPRVLATVSGGVYWFSAFFPAASVSQYQVFQAGAGGTYLFDWVRAH